MSTCRKARQSKQENQTISRTALYLHGVLWASHNTPHEPHPQRNEPHRGMNPTEEKPSFPLFGTDCRAPTEAPAEADITFFSFQGKKKSCPWWDSKRRAALGGIRTHNTLLSRRERSTNWAATYCIYTDYSTHAYNLSLATHVTRWPLVSVELTQNSLQWMCCVVSTHPDTPNRSHAYTE